MWCSDFLMYDFNPRGRYISFVFLGNNGNLALDAFFNDKKNSEMIAAYEMCWEKHDLWNIWKPRSIFIKLLFYYWIFACGEIPASCSVEVWVALSRVRSVLCKLTKHDCKCPMSLLTLQNSQPGAEEEKWAKGLISMVVKFSHEIDIFSFYWNSLLFLSAVASSLTSHVRSSKLQSLRSFISFSFPGCITIRNPVMITCEIKW